MDSNQSNNTNLLKNITFRCYAELNDFLPPQYSQFRSFTRCLTCNSELVLKEKGEIQHLVQ